MTLTLTTATESGRYVVYHRSEAGNPAAFTDERGDWYFEPEDWYTGEPFSCGFPTCQEALDAAEEWEAREVDRDSR